MSSNDLDADADAFERARFAFRRAAPRESTSTASTASTADGAFVIVAYLPNIVCRYEVDFSDRKRTKSWASATTWRRGHDARVDALACDARANIVLSGDRFGTIIVRDIRDDADENPREIIAHGDGRSGIRALASGTVGRRRGVAWSDVDGALVMRFSSERDGKRVVLDRNSGAIECVRWGSRNVLAWTCDVGVKLYDVGREMKIAVVERARGSPLSGAFVPHLSWNESGDGGKTLIIAWADCVKVVKVERMDAKSAANAKSTRAKSLVGADSGVRSVSVEAGGTPSPASESSSKSPGSAHAYAAKVVSMFQTEYYIAGAQPFGDALALLAWTRGDAPELHIVSKTNVPISIDVLAMKDDVEHLSCDAYSLVSAQRMNADGERERCQRFGDERWWTPGAEPRLVVLSPKDLIIAKPHGAKETIDWLSTQEDYVRLLDACEAATSFGHVDGGAADVGQRVLAKAFADGEYARAAALCEKLLRRDASAWEFWIEKFITARALGEIHPYIPTENPTLSAVAYETVLHAFLAEAEHHARFLTAVKVWPARVYFPSRLIPVVKTMLAALRDDALAPSSTNVSSVVLRESLAELYLLDGQRERALNLYLDIGRPSVLNFIARHDLVTFVPRHKLSLLAQLDTPAAMTLFVTSRDVLPPSVVAPELLGRGGYGARELAHTYLSELFRDDPRGMEEFHDKLFDLHLEFSPTSVMTFLKTSDAYDVKRCAERLAGVESLVFERVYLLSKLGSHEHAVRALLEDGDDLPRAIELASALDHPRDLWDVIIKVSAASPEHMSALLARTKHLAGADVASSVVRALNLGVPIANLKSALVDVICSNALLAKELRASLERLEAASDDAVARRAKIAARALRRNQVHVSRALPSSAPKRALV